jgi:hypothetical protein
MYKKIVLWTLLSFELTYAALPPRYQKMKDLDVMVDYIRTHQKILSTLGQIDLITYSIYYNYNCRIHFERKTSFHLPGWVGPAEDLVFKSNKCSDTK